MPRISPLSRWEMDVVRIVWEIGPATVREIHERVSEFREVDFSTVQTYLRRLEGKEYLNSTLKRRSRVYVARKKPRTVIRDNVADLVERLFGGKPMPLVRHLIEEQGLDRAEIAELRKMIDALDDKKPT